MKTHTTAFKNKVKDFGREIDSIITCNIGGIDIELSNAMLNSVSSHYEGGILKSVMKQLDVDSNVEVPEGTIINYTFGVKVRNDIVVNYRDNYDYVDFGEYIVYKSEKQEDTNSWKLTCYDKMLYTMKDYVNLNITYPITIRDYINTLCNFLGLTFKNASDTFANYDKQIQNELYMSYNADKKRWESLGYTFRDVFDELAQVTASTICINEEDGELEIRYINDTEDTINERYLKDINVNFGKKFGKVNSIVLARSADSDVVYKQDEESVTENGLCEIKISDNQIMNFNDRSDYLPDILDTLDGLEYYINDFSSTGITYYNVCDRYNIQIGNNTYSCIMFNDEINVTQGLEENIYTEMPGESVTDYSKADKTDRKINQTYLIVNKQLGEIIAHVDTIDDDYAEMKLTVDGLELDVTKHGDNILMGTDLYDLSKWGIPTTYYLPSPTPPDSSLGFEYWYCTENNSNYEKGVIYQYVNNTWVATDLLRKDLWGEKDQKAEIIYASETMNSFVSQRALKLGYTRTEGYIIDNTQSHLTFSCKLQNTLTNGKFIIFINQTSDNPNEEEDYNVIQNETILIEEQTNLTSIERTFEINRQAKYVIIDLFTQLNQGETTQDGYVLIGDIKLEYGQTATTWTNNYNEVYGKNYRLDDKGFKISKADNELFLDEDELTGKYKGDIMFQITGDRVYSKNGVFEATNQNGLVTKKLSNGMYVRYIED